MDLPLELQPTDKTELRLPDGAKVALPTARPQFSAWRGAPVSFDYGGKPIVSYAGEACFAELAILRLLLAGGWEGVWVEAYGGTHYLRSMPQAWNLQSEHVQIPPDKERLLQEIWRTAKTTSCFDVLAWRGEQLALFEAKRAGKDRLTAPQLRFIQGALACGVPLESLIIVEWEGALLKD